MLTLRRLVTLVLLVFPALAFAQAPTFQARWNDSVTPFTATSIAVSASGVVYVPDMANNRIGRYTIEGVDLGAWPATNPLSVATAADGRVFVGTQSGTHVTVYSPEGGALDDWAITIGPGPADIAWGLALGPDGDVYAAAEGAVLRFHPDGTYVRSYKSNHSSHQYTAVAVGPDSVVYVTECVRCSIHQFVPGVPLPVELSVNNLGSGCGLMWGVATDAQGRLTVSLEAYGVLRHFDQGIRDWEIPLTPNELTTPRGLAYDTRGHLLVLTGSGHYVSRYGLGETRARPTTWGTIKSLYR